MRLPTRMRLPDSAHFETIVRQVYPHLIIEHAQLNQTGQYNDVLIVNGEFLFRFPKFAEGIDALRREVGILNRIQDSITLAIPHPIFQHLDTNMVGEACIGYRILPGQPLWTEQFKQIRSPIVLVRMAHQLAGFLRELHAIPTVSFQKMDLPLADQVEAWQDLYARIQQRLFPHMRTAARQQVATHFEEYFATPQSYHFTPVLRHGDFGTGNLLHAPLAGTISGVIDFGATTLGDPAIDFAGLFSFGEDFCRHCYDVYPELEAMLPRVRFYRGTFALQEALYGIENDDLDAFASGMAAYR